MSGTRVGALDCGTNSLRLLVTELDPATGTQVDLDRRLRIVRLGEGVDRTGRLDPAALRRALRVVEEYADVCAEHAVEHVRVGATSAVRDAANAGVFAAGVHDVLSVVPEVLTGKEEARLTATGALRGLAGHAELGDPVLVVDIGGGSTELVQATGTRGAGGAVQAADGAVRVRAGCSLDVGSVRLTERHLHSDPSTPAQRQAATADVDAALDTTTTDWDALAAAVGVAGTVTSVAAHVLGQRTYDARRVHGATLARADVLAACRWLAQASIAQRLERLPWLPPGRADVIGGGALVLERVLLRLSPRVVELVVSEQDILDGLAWSLVEP